MILTLALGIVLIVAGCVILAMKNALIQNRCINCSYDIRYLCDNTKRCPECGYSVESSVRVRAKWRHRARAMHRLAISLVIIGVALIMSIVVTFEAVR